MYTCIHTLLTSINMYLYRYIINMSQSWWITVNRDVTAWTASVRTPGRGHGGVGAVIFGRWSGHGWVFKKSQNSWDTNWKVGIKRASGTTWNHETINLITAVSWFLSSKSASQVVQKKWLLAVLKCWLGRAVLGTCVTTWSGAKQRRGPSSKSGSGDDASSILALQTSINTIFQLFLYWCSTPLLLGSTLYLMVYIWMYVPPNW